MNPFQIFDMWSEWSRTMKLWGLRPDRGAMLPGLSAEEHNAHLAREREELKRSTPPDRVETVGGRGRA
jgi:hypothetical protein